MCVDGMVDLKEKKGGKAISSREISVAEGAKRNVDHWKQRKRQTKKQRNSVVRIKIIMMCKKFSYTVLFHLNIHTDILVNI